jgi:hypothetical protein
LTMIACRISMGWSQEEHVSAVVTKTRSTRFIIDYHPPEHLPTQPAEKAESACCIVVECGDMGECGVDAAMSLSLFWRG